MSSDTSKIFYSSLKLKKSWKINFFSSFWASKSPLSLASNLKKSHVDTFVCIKTVWSFVWSRRLLLRVPMDLNMYLTSYFGVFSALEFFFGVQSTRQWYAKLQFFVILHLDFCFENDFESIISKNHRVVTFSQLKTVWSTARHRCWLLRMPMDLNKCLTTYFDVLSASENFFELTKEEHCLIMSLTSTRTREPKQVPNISA